MTDKEISHSNTEELEKNRAAYESMKDELERDHLGRVALFHDGKLMGIYNDAEDAYTAGESAYGLGHFTTQPIGGRPIELGILTLSISPVA